MSLPPGFLIAAPRSGAGKTTVSLGLMRAFAQQGLAVAPVKCGPDYIDPAFHAAACGRQGVNLDSWAMGPEAMLTLAATSLAGADLAVGEGLMGLFDGVPGAQGRTGASAEIAAALGWPVLLVLDVSGQSQSAAAIVKGFASYDPRVRIGGVILNRVGSPRHEGLIRAAVEALGIPVLGSLPRAPEITLPERHLGLVQAGEIDHLSAHLDRLAEYLRAHADLAAIRGIAAPTAIMRAAMPGLTPPGQRIALAADAAFSFVYAHLLQGWRAQGAEIYPFSPLADEAPDPACDVCWLPGGYPELHAGQLAGAAKFLEGLRQFATEKPIHGECGGYMVLGQGLVDAQGERHAMAGLLDVTTSFATRKLSLGYRRATLLADGVLGRAGREILGHEFHYATVLPGDADVAFAETRDAYGNPPLRVGSRRGRVTGSFFHAIARA